MYWDVIGARLSFMSYVDDARKTSALFWLLVMAYAERDIPIL
jgi:hypothetical protein